MKTTSNRTQEIDHLSLSPIEMLIEVEKTRNRCNTLTTRPHKRMLSCAHYFGPVFNVELHDYHFEEPWYAWNRLLLSRGES